MVDPEKRRVNVIQRFGSCVNGDSEGSEISQKSDINGIDVIVNLTHVHACA